MRLWLRLASQPRAVSRMWAADRVALSAVVRLCALCVLCDLCGSPFLLMTDDLETLPDVVVDGGGGQARVPVKAGLGGLGVHEVVERGGQADGLGVALDRTGGILELGRNRHVLSLSKGHV